MNREYELMHFGVKGMKWGVKKNKDASYASTGIRSVIARRSNEKVDKGFKDWNENAKKRDNAIELGKKATAAKLAYERNKTDKGLKSAYKDANKQYKKALSDNTTYRKGVVRQEVGRYASRKYLSEAKTIKKQLTADPSNKTLQKKYNNLMSKHDVERANARRAVDVAQKRSNKKASLKRAMTMTVKGAATSVAVSAGAYAANRYLNSDIGSHNIQKAVDAAKKVKNVLGYMY